VATSNALAQQIAAMQAEMIPQIPEEALNTMMAATQALVATGLADKALNAGQTCPDFELKNAHGNIVSLDQQLKNGPQVISFYRGAWCPYCNLEIKALKENLPAFRQLGADLIAISPQIPNKSLAQEDELNLEFEVLSDTDNQLARQFGLVFTLPEEIQEFMMRLKLTLRITMVITNLNCPSLQLTSLMVIKKFVTPLSMPITHNDWSHPLLSKSYKNCNTLKKHGPVGRVAFPNPTIQ